MPDSIDTVADLVDSLPPTTKGIAMQTAESLAMPEIEFARPGTPPAANVVPVPVPATDSGAMMLMIQRFATDPSVDVAKLEKLLDLRNQQRDYDARVEFDHAMSAAQEEMDPVRKNAKSDKGKYASYDALDGAIRHIYARYGFAISYNTAESRLADHVKVLARASHRAGHRENYQIDMPADGKGAKGNDVMTKTHATGSAFTYGKRYLLAGIFNIAVTNDDDGGAAGNKAAAGTAGGGGEFRPVTRSQSSAHGRELAADDPHLVANANGRSKGTVATPIELTKEQKMAKKITDSVDEKITLLRGKTWTKFELADFWHYWENWISWMQDPKNAPDAEYQRFYAVYSEIEANARDV